MFFGPWLYILTKQPREKHGCGTNGRQRSIVGPREPRQFLTKFKKDQCPRSQTGWASRAPRAHEAQHVGLHMHQYKIYWDLDVVLQAGGVSISRLKT